MDVVAQDFYFGGPGDLVEGLTVTPLGERFYGVASRRRWQHLRYRPVSRCMTSALFPGNTPELGLMLVTNGDRGAGNRGGATQDTEALLFQTP